MSELQPRHRFVPLVDVLLLLVCLATWFWLNPAIRPEPAMLVVAAAVQLSVGSRREQFILRSLGSALGIFLAFGLYWQRPGDGWPLLPWLLSLGLWRWLTGQRAGLPDWMTRVERPPGGWARQAVRESWNALRDVLAQGRAVGKKILAWTDRFRLQPLTLTGATVLLMWPYLTGGIIGAGDAEWYACTTADYVLQMRAGVFPVWVAQTDYSFYGGVFPLRFAPYLAHLAGVIDLITFRQLPPYGVINAVLFASLLGGVLSMYACLRAIMRDHRWMAAGLAMGYGLCPGVLGLAYAQDLYMSFCALPFLPVAFLGVVRSFREKDRGSRWLMVGGVAAAWLAHPPIGFWGGVVVAILQVGRLALRGGWQATWKDDVLAAGLFLLLVAYPVVSAHSLGPQVELRAMPGSVEHFLKASFPANWLPLHPTERGLHNLQLGYGLAGLGVLAAWTAAGPGRPLVRLLLGCAAGLLVVLLPLTFPSGWFWHAMPQIVLNLTNAWPAQRLLPLVAVCVVTAAGLALSGLRDRPGLLALWRIGLVGALAWGGWEAGKFVRTAEAKAGGWGQTEIKLRPENRRMTEAALGAHGVRPRYFNHGVTNLQLEHRFLDPVNRQVLRHVTDAIIPGVGAGEAPRPGGLSRQFGGRAQPGDPGVQELEPLLTLAPGKFYLLGLDFPGRIREGTLLLHGREFHRVYGLPEAGGERAFGAGPSHARWLALWQTTGSPVDVRVTWIPAGAEDASTQLPFANFELKEYDPAALDVVIESLIPYRARVEAPADCYLETIRLCIPGYEARLDGKPVPVEMSPDGFVMVRMGPGRHRLELVYSAPPAVQLAYWLGVVGWLAWAWLGLREIRGARAREQAA